MRSLAWGLCLEAARWISQVYNIYYNLDKAIWVSLIVNKAENNADGDLDEDNNTCIKAVYKNIVDSL